MVKKEQDERRIGLKGRAAWALAELEKAGSGGITSWDYPGVRLSDAIFRLRQAGFVIETIREQHGGKFPGSHGRYCLIKVGQEVSK
ncbi:MAG: helix-turn-helix domain-containing protein [Pseudomonadota bacterium]